MLTFAAPPDTSQESKVVAKVRYTVLEIQKNALGTLKAIQDGVTPYRDAKNSEFYVFVYDTQVNIVAHPNPDLVGKNFKGKADVRGKPFRDEIVKIALEKGRGWVDYHYRKPGELGIFKKSTYFEKAIGSNGKIYIIACGLYK